MSRPRSRRWTRPLAYAWAAPTTALGLVAGGLTLLSGGRAQTRRGVLEFHGGFSTWYMRRVARASAMTLGHVIIARDADCLDFCRDHEHAHVRQAERWGPIFLPAYLACCAWEWSRRHQGRHYYWDNWFERDARRACGDPGDPPLS
jgi:hypothetical protein